MYLLYCTFCSYKVSPDWRQVSEKTPNLFKPVYQKLIDMCQGLPRKGSMEFYRDLNFTYTSLFLLWTYYCYYFVYRLPIIDDRIKLNKSLVLN